MRVSYSTLKSEERNVTQPSICTKLGLIVSTFNFFKFLSKIYAKGTIMYTRAEHFFSFIMSCYTHIGICCHYKRSIFGITIRKWHKKKLLLPTDSDSGDLYLYRTMLNLISPTPVVANTFHLNTERLHLIRINLMPDWLNIFWW